MTSEFERDLPDCQFPSPEIVESEWMIAFTEYGDSNFANKTASKAGELFGGKYLNPDEIRTNITTLWNVYIDHAHRYISPQMTHALVRLAEAQEIVRSTRGYPNEVEYVPPRLQLRSMMAAVCELMAINNSR